MDSSTLKAYRIDLVQFCVYSEQANTDNHNKNLKNYIVFLHSKYKIKTVKRKIASIKAFYNYLECQEIISENPFPKLQIKLHEPFLLPKFIPFGDIQRILQYAYQQKSETQTEKYEHLACLRDVAALELLFATGMRVSELCSLHLWDIDMVNGSIKIYGKGAKERIVQIGKQKCLNDAFLHLRHYLSTQSCYFFVDIMRKFGKRRFVPCIFVNIPEIQELTDVCFILKQFPKAVL